MNEEKKEKQVLIYLGVPDDFSYRDIQVAFRNAVYKISNTLEETPLPEGYEKWAPAIINITEDVYHINPYDIVEEQGRWGLFKLSIATLNMAKADLAWFPRGYRENAYTSFEYDLAVFGGLKILTEEEFDASHPGFVGAAEGDIPKAETELLKEVKEE